MPGADGHRLCPHWAQHVQWQELSAPYPVQGIACCPAASFMPACRRRKLAVPPSIAAAAEQPRLFRAVRTRGEGVRLCYYSPCHEARHVAPGGGRVHCRPCRRPAAERPRNYRPHRRRLVYNKRQWQHEAGRHGAGVRPAGAPRERACQQPPGQVRPASDWPHRSRALCTSSTARSPCLRCAVPEPVVHTPPEASPCDGETDRVCMGRWHYRNACGRGRAHGVPACCRACSAMRHAGTTSWSCDGPPRRRGCSSAPSTSAPRS